MSTDNAASLERFRELLRIPTVSRNDESLIDWAAFDDFTAALARLYPRTFETLEHEVVDGHSLLLRWPGTDAQEPLVLMAHMDVVPVIASEWRVDPFAAEIIGEGADAELFARGAIDDKGSLVAILEAVEALVGEGFTPAHDVYLSFGHNEETFGGGAQAIVDVLQGRGVRPGLVLDEGGAVVEGAVPGVELATAMVGVAERGVMTLVLTVSEEGGHASTPPAMPATSRLARAIDRIQRHPFPVRIAPPVRALFATVAPHAPQPARALFENISVTGPVLARALAAKNPEMNAMVRTTAVATQLSGAPADNVLATTASAAINIRLLTGDTVDSATEHIRRAISDPRVEITLRHGSDPSPVSPWQGEPWQRIARAVHDGLGEEILTTPYIQLGASDSRYFTALSAHVYRFTPFHLTRAERDALHSHNERIHVDSWLAGIRFYEALVRAS